MSDIIRLLPDSVANQIAAGEVIQRPASVVKELVENAIDAGATEITVVVVDAGRTSIQVIDNGKGMSETDARLSFERHATSKIQTADDLFKLSTMGFRGEALASIAAVAQVELKTRLETQDIGSCLYISGSEFKEIEPCTCSKGCSFKVNNLFFNVPARRKFLKSNATELTHIITIFERIALIYPQIKFVLKSNSTEVYNLKPGTMMLRISEIIGKNMAQHLISIKAETSIVKITGFIGKPDSARKKGAKQFFFVNGRFMKHPYFNKAITIAYENIINNGYQVPYFISFQVDTNDIDVNIHPTKTEIKFENEQPIWQILLASIRETIGKFNGIDEIDFNTLNSPEIPTFSSHNTNIKEPIVNVDNNYNPFKNNSSTIKKKQTNEWDNIYQDLINKHNKEEIEHTYFDDFDNKKIEETKSPIHYQYKGRYIVTAVKSGLMFIDQHRAHIRILFENYLDKIKKQAMPSQKLLFPEILQLTSIEAMIIESVQNEMEKIGFELSFLGNKSYSINGVPAGMNGVNAINLIKEMLHSVEKQIENTNEIHNILAIKLAQSTAIPYAQILNNDEMEDIINQLFQTSNTNHTPDGKIIMTILKQNEIDNLFK